MLRALAAIFLVSCSCAHNPTDTATNLVDLIEEQITAAPVCTGLVKLTGQIGDPSDLQDALEACKDRAVVLEINSPGGSIFGAIEMQKAIERHPYPVICVVDGMAASAAFVTLQSCDMRLMTPRSILMAHHASLSGAGGKSEDLENAANALRAVDRAMTLFICKRMGLTVEEFESHVSGNREWWLAADEAKTVNAIDFQIDSIADAMALANGK